MNSRSPAIDTPKRSRQVGINPKVAAAAVWLCSQESAFITGTTLTIDGGKLAGAPPFNAAVTPSLPSVRANCLIAPGRANSLTKD